MKRTAEGTAANDLADVLASLPLGLVVSSVTDRASDLHVDTPDGHRLEITVKSLRSPAPPDVDRLERGEPFTGSIPVLVADRLVPRVRDRLRGAGWGWLDRRGHLFLAADGLLVDTDVPALVDHGNRGRPHLETAVGLDVASAMLTEPTRAWSVRRLVEYTGRSLGAVHKAKQGLGEDGLLQGDGLPLIPELFWEVSDHWRPRRVALGAAPDPRSVRADRLGLYAEAGEVQHGSGWAMCDTIAANAYGASAAVRGDHPPDFYVPDDRAVRIARQILGDATTTDRRGATVAIAPAGWVCRHRVDLAERSTERRSTWWPLAHPIAVALDLSTDAGRGHEILDAWSPPEPFERVW